MEVVKLYKYQDPNGYVVTPVKRAETDEHGGYRLIADEGKALTKDGIELYPAIDTDSVEVWYEVDAPEEEKENLE